MKDDERLLGAPKIHRWIFVVPPNDDPTTARVAMQCDLNFLYVDNTVDPINVMDVKTIRVDIQ